MFLPEMEKLSSATGMYVLILQINCVYCRFLICCSEILLIDMLTHSNFLKNYIFNCKCYPIETFSVTPYIFHFKSQILS
jgi:hypothetical protein